MRNLKQISRSVWSAPRSGAFALYSYLTRRRKKRRNALNAAHSKRFATSLPFTLAVAFIGLVATNAPAESLLLSGATVHTISGETLSPGQVLIENGKISAVGATLSATGAKVMDLKGQHLYPGFIALNT